MSVTQQEFSSRMDAFFADLGGTVGVVVDHLDTDLTLSYNADEMYPTASTLKVPILYELFRQADEGKVDLSARVTLTHENRVPGSGVLQNLDEGLQPTIRDLAELMIIVSDNWATDLVYDIISKEPLAQTLQNLGLHNTHIPLTIREMFSIMADVDVNDPKVDYDFLKTYLKTYKSDESNIAFAADPRNDVSTPADMAKLMRIIHQGEGLTEDGRAGVIKILKDQMMTSRIPARLPPDNEIEVAHKTGTIRGVVNDVGILYSPGVNYVVAFMSKGQNEPAETVDTIARASRWIWDQLSA